MDELNILDADLPTMIVRCNNKMVLRSVITGQHIEVLGTTPCWKDRPIPIELSQKNEHIEKEFAKVLKACISLIPNDIQEKTITTKRVGVQNKTECSTSSSSGSINPNNNNNPERRIQLPPCKVQRNYSCTHCNFNTQNPLSHLMHQKDVHGVRLSIHTCQHCQYASRYCQKLKRHVKMVHSEEHFQDRLQVKTEKPIVTIGNYGERREVILKPIELTKETEITLRPPPVIPSEIKIEKPETSKIPFTPQPAINLKSDPEAFFVSAYKNQLKQFEKDQQVKNLEYPLNRKTENLTKIPEVPKQPIEIAPPLVNQHQEATINMDTQLTIPEPVEPGSNGEYDKKNVYSCRKCNYVTHIKSRYNKHVKYHSMPMIQCVFCEFRTTYKWNLTRHLRNHEGTGIYKCSICSFSANMKQSLTSHEINHHSPPVGSATRNKTTRKRRCRVGGSDLQAECNSGPIVSSNTEKSGTSSQVEPEISKIENKAPQPIAIPNKIIIDSISKNENDLNNTPKITSPYSNSMDTSDIESSNVDSSEGSDMETNDIESSNSSGIQRLTIVTPLHIDADSLNDDDDVKSNLNILDNKYPSTTNTITNTMATTPTSFSSPNCIELSTNYQKFDRSSSTSTLSADESSHLSSENASSSSSQTSKRSSTHRNVSSNSYRSSPCTSDDNFSDTSQEIDGRDITELPKPAMF